MADQEKTFEVKDVWQLKGNFFPSIFKKAQNLKVENGLCIVQSFEPIPLYSALKNLGYEHQIDKISKTEYRVYFYSSIAKESKYFEGSDAPLKPTAIVNFNYIDPKLANVVISFWDSIWGQEKSSINMKNRLLLSLANGVGTGHMRQATRELIKAYSIEAALAEFDELFAMYLKLDLLRYLQLISL